MTRHFKKKKKGKRANKLYHSVSHHNTVRSALREDVPSRSGTWGFHKSLLKKCAFVLGASVIELLVFFFFSLQAQPYCWVVVCRTDWMGFAALARASPWWQEETGSPLTVRMAHPSAVPVTRVILCFYPFKKKIIIQMPTAPFIFLLKKNSKW